MQEKEENTTKTIHRLSKYITTTGNSFNKLAIELGLSNSYFSKMVKNGGSIGSDIIENILRIHPSVNPEWLLTGQGSMLRKHSFIEPENWIEWSKESHQSNYRLDRAGLRLSKIATQKKIELFELKNLIEEDDDFYKMISGEIPVSEIVFDKIHGIYPDISEKWMYTGHGDMFSPITESAQQLTSHQQENNIISLLKEQLKEERQHSEKQAQEIGMLKSDNRKLMEQVMGLDISGCKSSISPSQSPSKDAPSVTAHL